ncbi:pyruvate formate lyase family protein [Shigella flexneri]
MLLSRSVVLKIIEGSCKAYNRELDSIIQKIFTEYRKTHNQGVFDVYTPDILRCRKSGVLTVCQMHMAVAVSSTTVACGVRYRLPDERQKRQFTSLCRLIWKMVQTWKQTIRLREEIAEQHRALGQMKEMAANMGYDISGPATNAQERIQWTYFGYWLR